MDDRTLNKISIGISLAWLLILLFRMAFYSAAFTSTPEGKLFMDLLNIFLIVGLLLIALMVLRKVLRYSAAKTMKATHCQQCYAKIPKGEMFCPKCGWAKPGYEPPDDSRKEY